jgi:hypothetical protein
MEAARTTETLVNLYQTTRRYDPEDSHLRKNIVLSAVKYSDQKMRYHRVEQKWFIYDTFVRRSSWRKFRRKFRRNYPDSTVPYKATIYNIVTKLRSTGLVLNKKISRKKTCADWIKTWWHRGSIRSKSEEVVSLLALQCGLAKGTAHIGTKLLKLRPHKTTVVHPPHCEARIRYCRWFQESIFKGLLDPEVTFYSDEA